MQVIPVKSFLVRQEDIAGGKKKDVIAKKGIKLDMSEKEAIKFWGNLKLEDDQKKKLLQVAKVNGYKRLV